METLLVNQRFPRSQKPYRFVSDWWLQFGSKHEKLAVQLGSAVRNARFRITEFRKCIKHKGGFTWQA